MALQHDDGGMWYTLVSVIRDALVLGNDWHYIRTVTIMHGYLKMLTTKIDRRLYKTA